MAAITSCPKCEQHVAVPDGVSMDADVRCPLCDEAFTLTESTIDVPLLIVVDESAAQPADEDGDIDFASFMDDDAASDDDDASQSTLGFADLETDDSKEEVVFDVADDDDAATDEADIDEIDFTTDHDVDAQAAASGIGFAAFEEGGADFAAEDATIDFGADEIASDEAEASGLGFADLDGGAEEGDAPVSDFGAAPGKGDAKTAEPPKKKKKASPVIAIAGFVLFGVLGICLGYVILLWVMPTSLAKFHRSMPFLDSVAEMIGPANVVKAIYEPPPKPIENDNPYGLPEIGEALTDEERSATTPDETPDPTDETPSDIVGSPDASDSLASLFAAGTAPAYSLEDLQKVRRAVMHRAEALEHAEKNRKSSKSARNKLYRKLCDLGEAATFFAAEMPQEVDAELAEVRTRLASALGDAKRRGRLGTTGYRWLFSGQRKPEWTGALVVGRVVSTSNSGNRVEIDVEVTGSSKDEPRTLRVLATGIPSVTDGQEVALLGSIVDQSIVSLEGYDSGEPLIVLSRVVLPLD